jgi:hypothetical protein
MCLRQPVISGSRGTLEAFRFGSHHCVTFTGLEGAKEGRPFRPAERLTVRSILVVNTAEAMPTRPTRESAHAALLSGLGRCGRWPLKLLLRKFESRRCRLVGLALTPG